MGIPSLVVEAGQLANKQWAAMIRYGETAVLATATMSKFRER